MWRANRRFTFSRHIFLFWNSFFHESKIDFVAKAKSHGYQIILIYIHLIDSSLNEARVIQRVSEGGHSVPSEKIHNRIPRTMKHIRAVLPLIDEARFLDNSSKNNPFQQIAVLKNGNYTEIASPMPEWAQEMLSDYFSSTYWKIGPWKSRRCKAGRGRGFRITDWLWTRLSSVL